LCWLLDSGIKIAEREAAMGKNKTPVVITRKDKRLKKGLHLLAFALTGGASVPVTAAKAATNAGYNARTRELQAEAEQGSAPRAQSPVGHREMLAAAAEKSARRAIEKGTPRENCRWPRSWPTTGPRHKTDTPSWRLAGTPLAKFDLANILECRTEGEPSCKFSAGRRPI